MRLRGSRSARPRAQARRHCACGECAQPRVTCGGFGIKFESDTGNSEDSLPRDAFEPVFPDGPAVMVSAAVIRRGRSVRFVEVQQEYRVLITREDLRRRKRFAVSRNIRDSYFIDHAYEVACRFTSPAGIGADVERVIVVRRLRVGRLFILQLAIHKERGPFAIKGQGEVRPLRPIPCIRGGQR